MSWALITIYLPFAAAQSPRAQVLEVATKAECRDKGRRWADSATKGRKWFFCAKRGAK